MTHEQEIPLLSPSDEVSATVFRGVAQPGYAEFAPWERGVSGGRMIHL
jgi:hypothetical protein